MDTHYLQDVFCLIIFAATYVSFLEANEECYLYSSRRWNDGIENNSLTNSWCIQYCNQKNNGYKYAGTKENECYCRKDAPISTFKVDFAFCNYICSGKSSTYCGGSHFSTYVTISLIGNPPSVSIPYPQKTANVGQQINLTCTVQSPSDPVDEIKWKFVSDPGGNIKDPVTSSSSTINKYDGSTITNPSLIINNVQLTDQGEYRCYARNKFGENSSSMLKLSVIETSEPSTSATTLSDSESTVKKSESSTHISTKSESSTHISTKSERSTHISTKSERSTDISTKSKTDTTDSLVDTVSNTQSSETSAGVRPKRLLCRCPKRSVNTKWQFLNGKDISDAELRKLVLEDFKANIKPLISVKRKNISKAIKKRTSVENLRKSAQSVGSGLSLLLIVPVALLIAADLSRCFYSIHKTNYRNKTTKKCKKSSLSNKTVIIENESFDHDDLSRVSKSVQHAIGFGNKPLDHQPRDTCDIHVKEVRFHAYHCDGSEIDDKTEMSLSTNRHKCNMLYSLDSNESGNRKRIIFSSDEATPECDWKRAGYEQRCNRLKRQRKSLKKRKDEVYC